MLGGGRSAGARCSSNNGEKERASVNQHHSVLHGWQGFCLTSICQTKRKLGTRTLPSCLTVVAASVLEGILLVPSTAEVFAAGLVHADHQSLGEELFLQVLLVL